MEKKDVESQTDLKSTGDHVKDVEIALAKLKATPDFYGKDFILEVIKSHLPETHPERLNVE